MRINALSLNCNNYQSPAHKTNYKPQAHYDTVTFGWISWDDVENARRQYEQAKSKDPNSPETRALYNKYTAKADTYCDQDDIRQDLKAARNRYQGSDEEMDDIIYNIKNAAPNWMQ